MLEEECGPCPVEFWIFEVGFPERRLKVILDIQFIFFTITNVDCLLFQSMCPLQNNKKMQIDRKIHGTPLGSLLCLPVPTIISSQQTDLLQPPNVGARGPPRQTCLHNPLSWSAVEASHSVCPAPCKPLLLTVHLHCTRRRHRPTCNEASARGGFLASRGLAELGRGTGG